MRLLLLAATTALMAGLVGCTESSAGQPRPSDSIEWSSSSLPARPRDIKLDGIEPCSLVLQADFELLGIEKPGNSGRGGVFVAPECLYTTNGWTLLVALVANEGVTVFDGRSGAAAPKEVAQVAGFPAISLALPESADDSCWVVVDVASGQFMLVSTVHIERTTLPARKPCEYAQQVAESAMRTLIAL